MGDWYQLASLTMYGAVAKAFTEPVSARFGITCLSLLLTYKAAAGLDVNLDGPLRQRHGRPGATAQ